MMNKSEFRKKAKLQIDLLFNNIEHLEEKKDKVSANAIERYEETIRNLKYKRSRLQQNYQELEIVAEEQWIETKKAFEHATSSVKEGVKKCVEMI
jgi:hypothetical protein